MTSVPPPTLPPVLPAATPAPVAAEVPVVSIPPEVLARLAVAKQLAGMVDALVQQNIAVVKTPLGTIELRLPAAVPPGSQILLQVVANPQGGTPQLRLVSVDGKPWQPGVRRAAEQPPAGATARPGAAAVAAPAMPGKPVQAIPSYTATVLRPPSGTAADGLPAGTQFTVRLVPQGGVAAPVVPAGQPAPGQGAAPFAPSFSPQPGQPAPGTPPSLPGQPAMPGAPPGPGAAAASPLPSPLPGMPAASAPQAPQPGLPAQASQPSVLGQAAPLPNAAPAAPSPATPQLPGQMTATVAPNTHLGQPLLQSPVGLLLVEGAPALPAGARVTLEVAGAPTPPQAGAPAPAPPPAGPMPGLSQALDALRAADPVAAERLTAVLPQIGPRLAEGMMVFAAALRADALKTVAGEAVASLEKAGKRDTARRLLQDLGDAAPQVRQAAGGEWRAMTLPFVNAGVIEPIRLYVRRRQEDGGEGGEAGQGGEGQRFLVDVTFSALGRLQLDGLVRRQVKRFDLILRTERPFSETMRRDIAGIFATCVDGLGVAGQVTFRAGQPFVEPEEPRPGLQEVVV